jgi:hypothetical protein
MGDQRAAISMDRDERFILTEPLALATGENGDGTFQMSHPDQEYVAS